MRPIVVAGLSLLLAACATLTKGTTQVVAVNTPGVTGATCTLTAPAIGTLKVVTPDTVALPKAADNIAVRCSKECYQDGAGVISSNLEGMAAGNIILGGVVGLGVDAATGAMNKYSPEVQVALVPVPGCGAAPAPRARKGA
jgi:hypothetical protein